MLEEAYDIFIEKKGLWGLALGGGHLSECQARTKYMKMVEKGIPPVKIFIRKATYVQVRFV